MKAKWVERAREGAKDGDTKSDEERRREWAVANRHGTNDTTFGVTTPDKNNKRTKTKHKPWTSKQFNWKCWMLQVCGWLGLLAYDLSFFSMVSPIASHFSFIITYDYTLRLQIQALYRSWLGTFWSTNRSKKTTLTTNHITLLRGIFCLSLAWESRGHEKDWWRRDEGKSYLLGIHYGPVVAHRLWDEELSKELLLSIYSEG